MVYIEQASDAKVDTTSDDKSSEEVEDVSENPFFLLLWFAQPQLVAFRLGCLFLLALENALSFELPELCNLFQNIGEGV
jgi:hypothetical protein